MADTISRREFIAGTAAAGVAGLLLTGGIDAQDEKIALKGLVARGHSDKVVDSDYKIQSEIVQQLVDGCLRRVTGAKTTQSAWKSLFGPKDRVSIKVNCIAGRNLSTRPEVVGAIVGGLRSAGVPDENIVVWDRTSRELINAGFQINTESPGCRCYGTDQGGGYVSVPKSGTVDCKLSKILTDCDKLINVPILKDHDGPGVTIAHKNHYGSVDNPGRLHGYDPALTDLNAMPEIKDKTSLIVVDAIYGCFDGGPGYRPGRQWYEKAILASRDPVAVDRVGAQMIDEERQKRGLKTLAESGRPCEYITTSGERGLGESDLARIKIADFRI
jgi:uncharacterized protein (DUF362 family)